MRSFQAGSAYVLVKPNLKGWNSTVRHEVTADAPAAGREAGSRIGSAMATAVKGSLAAIGATAAVIGGMALKGGLDRLLNIEDAEAKMRALGYTTSEVEGIMESALASVKGTAFGLGEAATTAANAVAAGIQPGQELTKYLTMTASAATLAGTSMEDMGSIVNKVNTSGKAYTDNLNQLADRGIPIFQWLAKEYGVTQEELSKMVRQGQVDAETFNKVLSENVGDAAVIAADTTRGAWLNLKASLSRIGANILEGVFPMFKKGFLQITEWMGPVEEKAKVVGKILGSQLANGAKLAAGAFAILFQGDYKSGFAFAEDSKVVDWLFRVRDGAITAWGELTGGIKAFAAAWRYNDGEVTSSGFPGFMERVGYIARQVFGWIKDQAIPAVRDLFKQGDTSGLGEAFSSIGDSVVKLAPAFGDFISQLPTFGDLVKVGATVLGFLADNVDSLRKWMPVLVGGFIAYKGAQIANNLLGRQSALGMGLQLVATRGLIISNRQLAAASAAAAAASLSQTTAQGAATAATGTQAAATTAATGATKKATAAQRLFNLSLLANPVGIIVAAIAGLVAAFILAYKTSDEFRAVVDKAFAKVKEVAGAVVSWFTTTAGPALGQAFLWVGEKAMWLWNNAISPAFTWIGSIAKSVFGWVKNTGWPWMSSALQQVGDKATWLWNNAISPAFTWILDKGKTVFGWVKDTGWPWMRNALQQVGDKATWLWEKVVTPAFNGIKSVISGAWDGVKVIFDKFKSGLNSVRDRFRSIRDGIGNIWGSMTRLVARPVNGVIGFFNSFLSGLEKAINLIPGVDVNLPRISEIAVPPNPVYGGGGGGGAAPVALAGGGSVPGPWRGPTADNVLGIGPDGVPLARINPREWIQPVASVDYYGAGFMRAIQNRAIPKGLLGLAGGGQVGGNGTDEPSWGKLLWDMIRDPKKAVGSLFDKLLSGIGDSLPAQIAVGAAKSGVSGLVKWVKDKLGFGEAGPGLIGGGGMPGGWSMMKALVEAAVPGARMSSGYRPGAVTASGFPSYHGKGRAVDMVGPMGKIFAWIRENYGRSSQELYWSPAGWLQMRHGRPHYPTGITRANHWDHVHWAMNQGGQVPDKPLLFDSGGYLPPGDSWVRNNTRAPEPLARTDRPLELSPASIRELAALINSGALQAAEVGARTSNRLVRQG